MVAGSFLVSSSRGYSQSETHDFITYDTVYNIGYGNLVYQMRITRPKNMFTPGNPDTASRPAIITMPGQGEMGTNPAKLQSFGPHYWLNNGWDGSVVLGNGTHYPILITILSSTTWPSAQANCQVLTYLLNTYHIKRNAVHLGGLSQGSFTWTGMIAYEKTPGDETGMKLVTSLTAFQGFAIVQDNPYQTWNRMDTAWGVWAKKYHGKFFGLEGTNDYRNVAEPERAMNDSVPGSAHFSYENAGGGNHCCWNTLYDPNQHNWQSFPPYGPYVAAGSDTNSRGTYKIGSSVFQWMLRQGDTTMVGSAPTAPPAQPLIISAGSAQTIQLPTSQVNLSGSGSDPNGGNISGYQWTVSGPAGSSIASPNAASTLVTGLSEGTYTFTLTITSSTGQTATSTVTVTVDAAAAPAPGNPGNPTAASGTYVKSVVVAEYKTWYIRADSTIWSYNAMSQYPVQTPLNGRKVIGGAGAFNYFRILDDQGYTWMSKTDLTLNTIRMDTDSSGAAFDGNWFIDAYAHVALTIRKDSSIWYFGKDEFNFFYTGGSLQNFTGTWMRPMQISPAGMKFKKALFGGNKIIGLTTAGDVYIWYSGNKTPTKMTIPRPAIDIFVSHLDVTGCIIPDVVGQTMGYPYVFGTTTSMYGGGPAYSQFTSLKSMWNMTVPIKEITASWNTIHYIDSLGRLWGCGFNSMGEVGNGQEFVNKYNYPGFPGYGWTFTDYENPSGVPVQVGPAGVKFKHLYSNNWFAFYKYAQDENDSIYSWGRNKALVLGNGFYNMQEQYSYDAMDVLKPTMVHPLTTIYQQYNFTAPTISVGPKQVITTNTATLTGVAKAPQLLKNGAAPAANGIAKVGYDIVSYKWTKVSGGACTITDATQASTTVTGLTTGTYIFNLLTTDNNTGTLSANDTIVVTNVVPGTPVANAGANQTITLPTSTVNLTGSGSETNGTITGYAWKQISGPGTSTIASPATAATAVSGLIEGVYRFQLTVTDAIGNTAVATVQVTVNPAPVVPGPPSANAGSDQTLTLPTSTTSLTGSGTETNGTIVSYTWTQTGGPNTATLGTPNQATTTVSGLIQGSYTFQLTVKDNSGVTATDVVHITVNPAVPVPGTPVANAGTNQTITLPTSTVSLTGSGSETNGTIVGYAWKQLSGPGTSTIASPATAATVVSGLIAGVYRFELTVTDANGVTATATVQITVNPAPVVPGTPSANAGGDQTITLPVSTASATGSGSETNGTIVSYAWTQTAGPVSATISAPNQAATSFGGMTVAGVYTFQLTVKDNSGVTATDILKITVNAAVVNKPPVADPGPDQSVNAGVTLTLDGSNSYDPDGTITKYAWTAVSGTSGVTITNANTSRPTLYGLQAGAYTFKLTVTDNSGATGSAQVAVTVSPSNTTTLGPVAVAGKDTTIYYPIASTVVLDGRQSYDNDGTIMFYSWKQISGPSASAIANPGISVTAVEQLLVGEYVFELSVTDDKARTSTSQVKVTVLTTLRHTGVTQLYPNPAPLGSQMTVSGVNDYLGAAKFTIYDISGRMMKQIMLDKQSFEFQQTIYLSGLSRGSYVLVLQFAGAKPETKKFIID